MFVGRVALVTGVTQEEGSGLQDGVATHSSGSETERKNYKQTGNTDKKNKRDIKD